MEKLPCILMGEGYVPREKRKLLESRENRMVGEEHS